LILVMTFFYYVSTTTSLLSLDYSGFNIVTSNVTDGEVITATLIFTGCFSVGRNSYQDILTIVLLKLFSPS